MPHDHAVGVADVALRNLKFEVAPVEATLLAPETPAQGDREISVDGRVAIRGDGTTAPSHEPIGHRPCFGLLRSATPPPRAPKYSSIPYSGCALFNVATGAVPGVNSELDPGFRTIG